MEFSAFPLLVGVFTLLVIFYITYIILREGVGTDGMVRIADRIRAGTKAYLNRQFKTIVWFIPSLAVAIYFFLGWKIAITFVAGSFLSLFTAYIGMNVVVRSNIRTADIAMKSSSRAFRIALLEEASWDSASPD